MPGPTVRVFAQLTYKNTVPCNLNKHEITLVALIPFTEQLFPLGDTWVFSLLLIQGFNVF